MAKVREELETQVANLERRVDNADLMLRQADDLDKHSNYIKDLRARSASAPKKAPAPVASFESSNPTVKYKDRELGDHLVFEWTVDLKNTGNAPGRPEMDLAFIDGDDFLIHEQRFGADEFEPGEERTERGRISIFDVAARDLKSVEVAVKVAR